MSAPPSTLQSSLPTPCLAKVVEQPPLIASPKVSLNSLRHTMCRPNGIGDLQRGERYQSMDYVLLSLRTMHN
ncbi:hypothetical protein C8J57DRAFT_1511363 [Mycena rebaudengoi]|nr:hypothetical protein C8J57DRAFT_1511363 [Mycena rebaudengoi]